MPAVFTAPAADGSWQSFLAQALEAEGAGNGKAALQYCMQASAVASGAAAKECSAFTNALADRHVQREDAAECARKLGNEAFSKVGTPYYVAPELWRNRLFCRSALALSTVAYVTAGLQFQSQMLMRSH